VTTDSPLIYRLVLAVDVERYSHRNALEQLRVQEDLGSAIDRAAKCSALDPKLWYRQLQGDGELAVLPEAANIPHIVGAFTHALGMALAELNEGRPDGQRLRLRLAFHYGTLAWGPFGPAGDAPIVVRRLVGSSSLRRLLADRHDGDLALIVSDSLYENVVRTGFCALDTNEFEPIKFSVKGIGYHGLITIPPSACLSS
jgi:class 3 adenylate cyclase